MKPTLDQQIQKLILEGNLSKARELHHRRMRKIALVDRCVTFGALASIAIVFVLAVSAKGCR